MKREYPESPIVTVGGIVLNGERVLLAQRGKEPNKGRWTIPGGAIELGESVRQAVEREVREECSLAVQAGEVVEVLETIQRDESGAVRFHYVIIDFVCQHVGGQLRPGDDVDDARWVHASRDEFDALDVFPPARAVIAQAHAGRHIS